ncbi:MAG: ATP-binding protein [Opitutus sp.]|nr:ATP-binding protein [Opitutus sp.]
MSGAPLRIAVFGPESTGKTTLAQTLAAHFGEPWSQEFVRAYWDSHDGKVGPADLDAIARGQIANEEAAAQAARRVMFCDTELLTCVLYDDLLFPGACPEWVRAEADKRARGFALYLLCGTDLPFEPDPQRCFATPEEREMCRQLWRDTLVKRGLPFVEINGTGEERAAKAITAVDELIRTRS